MTTSRARSSSAGVPRAGPPRTDFRRSAYCRTPPGADAPTRRLARMPGAGLSDRLAALQAALGAQRAGTRFVRAPGRVNLIGDHTDYQDGLCLPMAVDRDVRVRFEARADERVRVCSKELEGSVEVAADGTVDPPAVTPAWGRTVAA